MKREKGSAERQHKLGKRKRRTVQWTDKGLKSRINILGFHIQISKGVDHIERILQKRNLSKGGADHQKVKFKVQKNKVLRKIVIEYIGKSNGEQKIQRIVTVHKYRTKEKRKEYEREKLHMENTNQNNEMEEKTVGQYSLEADAGRKNDLYPLTFCEKTFPVEIQR